MTTQEIRNALENIYLEGVNNYLTAEKFAEHVGITTSQADKIIEAGKLINSERGTK